jgi:hypothetical protein
MSRICWVMPRTKWKNDFTDFTRSVHFFVYVMIMTGVLGWDGVLGAGLGVC